MGDRDRALGLVDHTIKTGTGYVAGFLLRPAGVDLGYIWCTDLGWRWQSIDGLNFGTRQSKRAAIETLHDLYAARAGRLLSLPAATTPEKEERPSRVSVFVPPTAPVRVQVRGKEKEEEEASQPPPRRVTWGDNPSDGASLTSALAAALNKHRVGGGS